MKTVSYIDIANFTVARFAKNEVLLNNAQKLERQNHLFRAMLLHYVEHQPVHIYFKNQQDDLFVIECGVIVVTDDHAMLKSGFIIPVQSIVLIELL